MEKNNFAENLLKKIKTENITPRPRWHFLLKDYVVWIFGALTLIVGSLAMSVIIYLLKYNNWEGALINDGSLISFFLITLPYFWILFLGLFIAVLYYNIKHSKKGYRYPAVFIVIFAFLASVILGELFFLFGLGEKIDDVLGRKAPLYAEMFNPQLDFWFQPDEGRLAGLTVISDGKMSVVDPSGKIWEIATTSETLERSPLLPGQPVNLSGQVLEDGVFSADFIKTPRPGRAFMERPGRAFGPGVCQPNAPCDFPGHKMKERQILKNLDKIKAEKN